MYVACNVYNIFSIDIKKDEKWYKIVKHSLKIEIFNMKTEIKI